MVKISIHIIKLWLQNSRINFTVSVIQVTILLKSTHLPTTSTVMFSDEKCKFCIAGSTVVAPIIRHPDRSHFARLKKKDIIMMITFLSVIKCFTVCVTQQSIHFFAIIIQLYGITAAAIYSIKWLTFSGIITVIQE